MNQTGATVEAYLSSLVLDQEDGVRWVAGSDGADLWRVNVEHYVITACVAHEHQGHERLATVFPPEWVCFYSAVNPIEEFEVHHYGPPWDDVVPATPEPAPAAA